MHSQNTIPRRTRTQRHHQVWTNARIDELFNTLTWNTNFHNFTQHTWHERIETINNTIWPFGQTNPELEELKFILTLPEVIITQQQSKILQNSNIYLWWH